MTRLPELLHAHGLVVVAAQILLEGHRLQHRHALAQRNLLVGVPEEARVVEAGAQHALIAVADQPSGSPSVFSTARKCGSQLAVRILHGEVLLVIAHHRDQNFFGKREKFRIEVAEDDRRKFGEIDDGVEQILVFAPARAGDGARGGVERFADCCSRSAAAGQHRACRQRRRRNRRRASMAPRPTTGCDGPRDAAGANAGKLERHDFAVEQGHQPAHRAHEALRRLAAPVHVLGPVDAGDLLGQRFGENLAPRDGLSSCTLAARYSPLGVVTFSSASTGTLTFSRKSSAAGVGCSIFVRDLSDGPVTCSVTSGCAAETPAPARPAAAAWKALQRRRFRRAVRAAADRPHGAPVRRGRCRSCAQEFLRYRSRAGNLA